MKISVKRLLPYIFTSTFVVGIWWLLTGTTNYAWNATNKEVSLLDLALTSIFCYKAIFWLVIGNGTVFMLHQLLHKKYKKTVVTLFSIILFYYYIGEMVDKKCAIHYYSVFINQSVSEEYIDRPIVQAGYYIGPILTEKIGDKEMEYRRYAIGGIEKIKYKPATPILAQILFDKNELDVYRADAYEALKSFDTEETRALLNNFKIQATDSVDMQVIELGEYFINNK